MLAEVAGPSERESLDQVRQQVSHLVLLVERLLILADPTKVEVGETVDLADVVEAVREPLSPEAKARVRVDVAQDVLVRGDGPLLRVLVANALENALKFSQAEVSLRVDADEGPRIVIEDSGPGLEPGELDEVRAHFRRGRHALREGLPGHGIGLTLMDHIVRAHGGELSLTTRSPRGTRVVVRLPPWRPQSNPNGR